MKHPIYVIQLEAKPKHGAAAANEATGAFANVYIRAVSQKVAIAQARDEVDSAGWRVQEVIDANVITEESFDDEGGLAYYRQCETDGLVVVFHTWRDEQ